MIEVLVALAILTIVLGTLVQGLTRNARNAAHLRDRTVAHWVAANTAAAFQLGIHGPSLGTERGQATMAGQSWYWTTRIEATEDPDLLRIRVEARADEAEAPLENLVSYVGRPSDEGL